MKDMDKDSSVIKLLKNAYEKSEKTYIDIFNETGIAQSFLSRILNGKHYASLAMLVKLGKALEVNPELVAKTWKKDMNAKMDLEIAEILKNT